MRRKATMLLLAAGALFAVGLAPASAQKQTLRMAHWAGPAHQMVRIQEAWIKTIEAASGGNLTVVGEAGSALYGKAWDAADEQGRNDAKQRGNAIETIAPAEFDHWRPMLQFVTDEWLKKAQVKGLDGQKMLDDLKVMIKAASS
jgi:TRAP-type C4-dicarboxylate transport system substrate-binding protein